MKYENSTSYKHPQIAADLRKLLSLVEANIKRMNNQ